MAKSTITSRVWDETFSLRANWAEASSPIEVMTEDGWVRWAHHQVADYRHDPRSALRAAIDECARAGGDDPEDRLVRAEIDEAMDAATES